MTRLADRLLSGCQPARVSAMVGPQEIEKFLRERLLDELRKPTTPEGFEQLLQAERAKFVADEPVAITKFDPLALQGIPVLAGDDVALYVDSLLEGTNMTDVVASMAPPFDRFFVGFQHVPNKGDMHAWGALVTAHNYSERFGTFADDEGTTLDFNIGNLLREGTGQTFWSGSGAYGRTS